jgi:hypothetical protein
MEGVAAPREEPREALGQAWRGFLLHYDSLESSSGPKDWPRQAKKKCDKVGIAAWTNRGFLEGGVIMGMTPRARGWRIGTAGQR